MINNQDYTNLTREELLAEQQKINGQKTLTSVLVGFFVGVAVWNATHKGGFLTFLLLFAAFFVGKTYNDKVKGIQAEIDRRG